MNPIKSTLSILLGWTILIILVNLIIGAGGKSNFIPTFYVIYTMPIIGVISYVIFLFFKEGWAQNNPVKAVSFGSFLFLWFLFEVIYLF